VPATRVSLTMIVRNEAENLPRALRSARGLFDETIVVDTGSTDRTRDIAREHGAKVFDFPWVDDFAAARNAALDHATGDYVMWLDADDVILPASRDKLSGLFKRLRGAGPAGYMMFTRISPTVAVGHVRLFPIRPDIRWTYRVHESIHAALAKAGIPVSDSDVRLLHTGYDDPDLLAAKTRRNCRLMVMELDELRDDAYADPYVLFNVGRMALAIPDPGAAAMAFRQALAIPPRDDFGLMVAKMLRFELDLFCPALPC
jgi:glycosyltransferase involved in cell wall biosynthesis